MSTIVSKGVRIMLEFLLFELSVKIALTVTPSSQCAQFHLDH